MLRETRKNALKNSGFEVRVLVDLVENDGGFVLGPVSRGKSCPSVSFVDFLHCQLTGGA